MGSAAHNHFYHPNSAAPAVQKLNPAPRHARFIILSPPLRGLEMVLNPQGDQRNWTLGSATGVDFYIRDPSLLGNHINITFEDDVWMITTHPSCRGCIVNGEPVETAVIEDGDRLLVGRFELVFLENFPA